MHVNIFLNIDMSEKTRRARQDFFEHRIPTKHVRKNPNVEARGKLRIGKYVHMFADVLNLSGVLEAPCNPLDQKDTTSFIRLYIGAL